jgi:nitrite reductase (NADH) large subunit
MISAMIVCQCRRVSDREVIAAIERGAADLADLARECGAGTDCRGCRPNLDALLAERALEVATSGHPRRLAVVAA